MIEGVDKIMETLRNGGIVCVGYIERTSTGNTQCVFHLFTLCSTSVIVLSDSLCEIIKKWETSVILKEDILLVCVFSWSIYDKNCHIRCIKSNTF
jgi:hypothetical protein